MKLSRSKSMFNIFTLFTLLAMLFGLAPVSHVQAEAPASPHFASGDFAWAKGIGGTSDDDGNGIAADSSDNVYTVGSFHGTVDFDPGAGTSNLVSAGSYDIFISKLDSSGNFVWAKSMGGAGYDIGSSIALDSSGNVYTTGHFQGTADFDPGAGTANLTSAGGDDIFISKLDGNGDFVWARSMGGTSYDDGYSIAVDSGSNIYTTGRFVDIVDFDPGSGIYNLTSAGNDDIFVSKLDSSGNFVWAKSMGGTINDLGYGIAVDSNDNVYTTGYFWDTVDFDPGPGISTLTSVGIFDVFISKLDSNGNFVWAKGMGGVTYDVGSGISVDSSGNVYTTGTFGDTVDFDPSAGTSNLTSVGGWDIFVSKLDSNGDFVWAKNTGGVSDEYGNGIALDISGNIYTTGSYNGTVDFDPGAGTFNLTSAGFTDIFVAKLDSGGDFIWAKSMGGVSDGNGNDVALDSSGNVYTTGAFYHTVDFDPGPSIFNLTSAGGNDIFISKLQAAGILYAIPSGTGDCSSWANACDLQYALTTATSGDEIWVAAGTYLPTTGSDRTATFQLINDAAVYGGFAGTESARSERDFTVNVTTLSGDLSGNDNDTILPDEPTRADNSYNVVKGANGAILDGFTVTAGNANGASFPQSSGGGLLDYNSSTTLVNILFLRNTSTGGGGMFSLNSDAILTDVTFRENNALFGGGGMYSAASTPTLTRVTFDGNSSPYNGGGMLVTQGSSSLTDVAFFGNSAEMGGGLYNESGLVMNNITFFDNSAITYGGGMMNHGSMTLTNATFAGNSAENGGGFADASGLTSTLTNVTFNGNTARTNGGAVYNLYSYVTIRNSILWGNTDLSGFQVYGDAESRISDSVIQGACSIYSICTNTITADPMLGTLGDYGGYTQTIPLLTGSSAIDATSSNCPLTDQRGLPRSTPACDIGAYELVDITPPDTTIDSKPANLDNDSTPTFTFSGNDGTGSGIDSFMCRMDGGTYATCTSPFTSPALVDSSHTFDVYAVDMLGNVDASPASYTWTIDTTAPDTTIIDKPASLDNDSTPTFTFSGNEGADSGIASFMCRMDGGTYTACTSPFTSSALADGSHTFDVYAVDMLGNADASPASHTWTLDTTAPDTTILTKPISLDNDSTPTFTFSGSDGTGSGVASFMCRMDGGTYTACTSPFTSPALADGSHTFDVYAVDMLGNADASPASYTWTLETISPIVTSITRVNPSPTNLASVGFTVTFSKPVTGVDMLEPTFDDFSLTTSSGIIGTNASVIAVSGSGSTYTVTVNTGSGNGTLRLDVVTGGSIVDAAFNPLADGFTTGEVYSVIKSATFADVPLTYWANSFIERLYNAGITGGCSLSPLMYCPETDVNRAQMAVFLLRGEHGSTYVPPAVGTGTGFTDVPTDYWAAAWIKQLAAEGITSGCGPSLYCPEASVTRDQMAVFLLRAEHGASYTPPPATGVFTDVPTTHWAAPWIEQLAAEGITGGCGVDTYCPSTLVTRAQMAVFLVRAFNLP